MLNLVTLGTQIDSFLREASEALIFEPVTIRVNNNMRFRKIDFELVPKGPVDTSFKQDQE